MIAPWASGQVFLACATLAFAVGVNLITSAMLEQRTDTPRFIIGVLIVGLHSLVVGVWLSAVNALLTRLERMAANEDPIREFDEFERLLRIHIFRLALYCFGATAAAIFAVGCAVVLIFLC